MSKIYKAVFGTEITLQYTKVLQQITKNSKTCCHMIMMKKPILHPALLLQYRTAMLMVSTNWKCFQI